MQKTIEELKRKAEQGSQQLQGEVLELQLESLLAAKFPHDRIEPVPKGEHGGDILQRVVLPTGAPSCRWLCFCGRDSSRSTPPDSPARGSKPRWNWCTSISPARSSGCAY